MEGGLGKVFGELSVYTRRPEQYLSLQEDVAGQLRKTIKKLYDITKSLEGSSDNRALSELIIDNFDDEQVWQEIELQNEPVISEQIKQISRVVASSDSSFTPKRHSESESQKTKKLKRNHDASQDTQVEGENGEDALLKSGTDEEEDLSEEEQQLEELLKKAKEELDNMSDDDDDDDDGLDGDDEDDDSDDQSLNDDFDLDMDSLKKSKSQAADVNDNKQPTKGAIKKRTSVVDDKFFKLTDMEMFLDQEDAKEERRLSDRPEGSDEEIDYFADLPSDDDKNLKYDDFFDPPEEVNETEQKKGKRAVKFTKQNDTDKDGQSDEGTDDDVEGEDVTDVIGGVRGEKSTFEKRQERIKKKISELEEAALAEKPWQLQGEVSSNARPENSLLEEDLDYERTTRLAPVITEETTKALEDTIKQRIKDKAWDDVEKKVKPVEEPYEYKKKIVLDQEKSKLSLSQLYEQEYLKQQQKEQEEQTDPEHEEIKKMMTSLFLKLDALSNFHYTPKPAVPEVKIVSNLPSITMEEVAPVSVSDANLMAPTEIQEKPKGDVKADTEKTETDRKRERREKKKRQKVYFKHKEEKLKALEKKNLGDKYSKEKALTELKKQAKSGRGVKIIEDSKKASRLTSSTQFFTQLQDEVTAHIQSKKMVKKETKKKDPAAKYKL